MNRVYNSIDKTFRKNTEKQTALNIANALYFGSSTYYILCNAGVTVERFNEIKKIVFDMMTMEVLKNE